MTLPHLSSPPPGGVYSNLTMPSNHFSPHASSSYSQSQPQEASYQTPQKHRYQQQQNASQSLFDSCVHEKGVGKSVITSPMSHCVTPSAAQQQMHSTPTPVPPAWQSPLFSSHFGTPHCNSTPAWGTSFVNTSNEQVLPPLPMYPAYAPSFPVTQQTRAHLPVSYPSQRTNEENTSCPPPTQDSKWSQTPRSPSMRHRNSYRRGRQRRDLHSFQVSDQVTSIELRFAGRDPCLILMNPKSASSSLKQADEDAPSSLSSSTPRRHRGSAKYRPNKQDTPSADTKKVVHPAKPFRFTTSAIADLMDIVLYRVTSGGSPDTLPSSLNLKKGLLSHEHASDILSLFKKRHPLYRWDSPDLLRRQFRNVVNRSGSLWKKKIEGFVSCSSEKHHMPTEEHLLTKQLLESIEGDEDVAHMKQVLPLLRRLYQIPFASPTQEEERQRLMEKIHLFLQKRSSK